MPRRNLSGFHQGHKFSAVQRFLLQQRIGQLVKPFLFVPDDFLGGFIAVFQHLGDFTVNLRSHFFAVLAALAEFHADKHFLVASEINRTDVLAHAKLGNHLPAYLGGAFQVAG